MEEKSRLKVIGAVITVRGVRFLVWGWSSFRR